LRKTHHGIPPHLLAEQRRCIAELTVWQKSIATSIVYPEDGYTRNGTRNEKDTEEEKELFVPERARVRLTKVEVDPDVRTMKVECLRPGNTLKTEEGETFATTLDWGLR
jgi:hypothetical protein